LPDSDLILVGGVVWDVLHIKLFLDIYLGVSEGVMCGILHFVIIDEIFEGKSAVTMYPFSEQKLDLVGWLG